MFIAVQPLPLQTLEQITKIFRVSKYTAKKWAEDGAPIFYTGSGYHSEYNQLFSWLSQSKKKLFSCSESEKPTRQKLQSAQAEEIDETEFDYPEIPV